jgi:NTP pyrophosphatase (non-canonical NTP hydrolase)
VRPYPAGTCADAGYEAEARLRRHGVRLLPRHTEAEMTTLEPVRDCAESNVPRAVLCGSFRRGIVDLRAAFDELRDAGCLVLSPASIDFVDEVEGFVLTERELGQKPAGIEAKHIDALRRADFVWLHLPEGYVGPSAALELGVAHSLDIPVFASSRPNDATIATFVRVVAGPADAVALSASRPRIPAGSLRDLQTYYARMASHRGFDSESPQDALLLLIEEVGELARAIRRRVSLRRAAKTSEDAAEELADIQLYVLHLANVIGIDLADAVLEKEQTNHARYGSQTVTGSDPEPYGA